MPYKGQEFDDHYFGSISGRVLDFMRDLEKELWLLGVPLMTRHNEVAPSQFELAPQYSGVSVSIDQNMLTMSVLNDVAERHGLAVLLHEKPYANFNGSGKHMNWSIGDDLGNNLLEPGSTPHENLKFMMTLTSIVRAVDRISCGRPSERSPPRRQRGAAGDHLDLPAARGGHQRDDRGARARQLR